MSAATYPVRCSWCSEEHRETIIRYTTVEGSHGICAEHAAALRAEMHAKRRAA